VYFYDPDENLIELAVLGQAHVSQPSTVPNHTA
jgi:hypothetical protein